MPSPLAGSLFYPRKRKQLNQTIITLLEIKRYKILKSGKPGRKAIQPIAILIDCEMKLAHFVRNVIAQKHVDIFWDDPDWRVRRAVARRTRSLDIMNAYIDDERPDIRWIVLKKLFSKNLLTDEQLNKLIYDPSASVRMTLLRNIYRAHPVLLKMIKDKSVYIRRDLAYRLPLEHVHLMKDDEDQYVRNTVKQRQANKIPEWVSTA